MVPEVRAADDPGVIDQQRQRSLGPGLPGGVGNRGAIRQVHRAGDGAGAQSGDFSGGAGQGIGVDVPEDHYLGAFPGGAEGVEPAHAAGGTGDQDHAAVHGERRRSDGPHSDRPHSERRSRAIVRC